jgi:hypothetical protein
MSPRSLVRRLSVAVTLTSLAAAPVSPAGRTYALASVHAATLERAREGAALELEQEECRRALEDFRDEAGRSLVENLAKWDRTCQ